MGLLASAFLVATAAHLPAEEAFTALERALLARNASLRAAAARDPTLVRRVFAALSASAARAGPATAEGTTRGVPLVGPPGVAFDADADPDLAAFQRSSPEAALDLFQLLKQVSSEPPRKPAQ